MQEIVDTEQPSVVDRVTSCDAAVIFYMQAECAYRTSLPEIEATGNFHISSARSQVRSFHMVVVVEIVIDKEIWCFPKYCIYL